MNKKFPDRFIERYKPIIPDFDDFLQILQTPLRQSFRVNTLKATKQEVLSLFSDIKLAPIPWCDFAFRIIDPAPMYTDVKLATQYFSKGSATVEHRYGASKTNIGDRAEHKTGMIYIQEAISMLPAIILEPKPYENVLDVAAAPGSKTTQIAAMMENTGCIVANDISKKRINALISNIERLGIINTVITIQVGQKLGYYAPDYFDKVLLDAPCSLEGTIRNTPEVLINWKETTIRRLSKLQKGLINSAFKCLKPNGTLVYSTCTFAPEENEGVVDYLFKKYSNVFCEPISITNLNSHQGILEWGRNRFNPQIKNCLRIYPHNNDTEGFFIAKIRKL